MKAAGRAVSPALFISARHAARGTPSQVRCAAGRARVASAAFAGSRQHAEMGLVSPSDLPAWPHSVSPFLQDMVHMVDRKGACSPYVSFAQER